MKNNVIFLDMDGTVVTTTAHLAYSGGVMPNFPDTTQVALVNRLALLFEAKIVISSAWRHIYTREELLDILRRAGLTVDFHENWNTPMKLSNDSRRKEIEMWLGVNEVDDYLILDDEVSEGKRSIKTNPEIGFNYKCYLRALDKLGIPFQAHRDKFWTK